MKLGFAIVIATYRTVFRYGGAALLLGALPLALMIGAQYGTEQFEGFAIAPFVLMESFIGIIYGAALLRVILLNAPVSLRTMRIGRIELNMFWVTLFLSIVLILPTLMVVPLLAMLPIDTVTAAVLAPILMFGYALFCISRFILAYAYILTQVSTATDAVEKSWRTTQGKSIALIIAVILTFVFVILGLSFALDYGTEGLGVSALVVLAANACLSLIATAVLTCMSAVVFQVLYEPPKTVKDMP